MAYEIQEAEHPFLEPIREWVQNFPVDEATAFKEELAHTLYCVIKGIDPESGNRSVLVEKFDNSIKVPAAAFKAMYVATSQWRRADWYDGLDTQQYIARSFAMLAATRVFQVDKAPHEELNALSQAWTHGLVDFGLVDAPVIGELEQDSQRMFQPIHEDWSATTKDGDTDFAQQKKNEHLSIFRSSLGKERTADRGFEKNFWPVAQVQRTKLNELFREEGAYGIDDNLLGKLFSRNYVGTMLGEVYDLQEEGTAKIARTILSLKLASQARITAISTGAALFGVNTALLPGADGETKLAQMMPMDDLHRVKHTVKTNQYRYASDRSDELWEDITNSAPTNIYDGGALYYLGAAQYYEMRAFEDMVAFIGDEEIAGEIFTRLRDAVSTYKELNEDSLDDAQALRKNVYKIITQISGVDDADAALNLIDRELVMYNVETGKLFSRSTQKRLASVLEIMIAEAEAEGEAQEEQAARLASSYDHLEKLKRRRGVVLPKDEYDYYRDALKVRERGQRRKAVLRALRPVVKNEQSGEPLSKPRGRKKKQKELAEDLPIETDEVSVTVDNSSQELPDPKIDIVSLGLYSEPSMRVINLTNVYDEVSQKLFKLAERYDLALELTNLTVSEEFANRNLKYWDFNYFSWLEPDSDPQKSLVNFAISNRQTEVSLIEHHANGLMRERIIRTVPGAGALLSEITDLPHRSIENIELIRRNYGTPDAPVIWSDGKEVTITYVQPSATTTQQLPVSYAFEKGKLEVIYAEATIKGPALVRQQIPVGRLNRIDLNYIRSQVSGQIIPNQPRILKPRLKPILFDNSQFVIDALTGQHAEIYNYGVHDEVMKELVDYGVSQQLHTTAAYARATGYYVEIVSAGKENREGEARITGRMPFFNDNRKILSLFARKPQDRLSMNALPSLKDFEKAFAEQYKNLDEETRIDLAQRVMRTRYRMDADTDNSGGVTPGGESLEGYINYLENLENKLRSGLGYGKSQKDGYVILPYGAIAGFIEKRGDQLVEVSDSGIMIVKANYARRTERTRSVSLDANAILVTGKVKLPDPRDLEIEDFLNAGANDPINLALKVMAAYFSADFDSAAPAEQIFTTMGIDPRVPYAAFYGILIGTHRLARMEVNTPAYLPERNAPQVRTVDGSKSMQPLEKHVEATGRQTNPELLRHLDQLVEQLAEGLGIKAELISIALPYYYGRKELLKINEFTELSWLRPSDATNGNINLMSESAYVEYTGQKWYGHYADGTSFERRRKEAGRMYLEDVGAIDPISKTNLEYAHKVYGTETEPVIWLQNNEYVITYVQESALTHQDMPVGYWQDKKGELHFAYARLEIQGPAIIRQPYKIGRQKEMTLGYLESQQSMIFFDFGGHNKRLTPLLFDELRELNPMLRRNRQLDAGEHLPVAKIDRRSIIPPYQMRSLSSKSVNGDFVRMSSHFIHVNTEKMYMSEQKYELSQKHALYVDPTKTVLMLRFEESKPDLEHFSDLPDVENFVQVMHEQMQQLSLGERNRILRKWVNVPLLDESSRDGRAYNENPFLGYKQHLQVLEERLRADFGRNHILVLPTGTIFPPADYKVQKAEVPKSGIALSWADLRSKTAKDSGSVSNNTPAIYIGKNLRLPHPAELDLSDFYKESMDSTLRNVLRIMSAYFMRNFEAGTNDLIFTQLGIDPRFAYAAFYRIAALAKKLTNIDSIKLAVPEDGNYGADDKSDTDLGLNWGRFGY